MHAPLAGHARIVTDHTHVVTQDAAFGDTVLVGEKRSAAFTSVECLTDGRCVSLASQSQEISLRYGTKQARYVSYWSMQVSVNINNNLLPSST